MKEFFAGKDFSVDSVFSKSARGLISIAKTVVLRIDRLSDRDVDQRLAVCRKCPGGHVKLKRNGLPLSCGPLIIGGAPNQKKQKPCGCLLRQKAKDAKEDCPFGYWPIAEKKTNGDSRQLSDKGNNEVNITNHAGDKKMRTRFHLDVSRIREEKIAKRNMHQANGRGIEKKPSTPAASPAEPVHEVRSLYDYFDKVFVVNLDRRKDRLDELQRHLSEIGWPFKYPDRFRAIDGQRVKPPSWWRAGASAWGCQQSHLQILEQAMMDELESVLILEDDVFFDEGFRTRVNDFLLNVPDDWQQIYLGGQHLYQRKRPPIQINDEVVIPYNVNRTHAFAVHRRGMLPIYRWLTDYVSHSKTPNFHIDHRLGELHSSGDVKVYAPCRWLAGQTESHSNIKGQVMPSRLWNKHYIQDHSQPFVAVIGVHRSGSSCLAGVLHKLGVHMGDRLGGYEKTGGYEAVGLSRLCEKAYPFPSTDLVGSEELHKYKLMRHIRHVQSSARKKETIAGGKYPHLCVMGNLLQDVCGPKLKVIHINRPLEESIQSLVSRSQKSQGFLKITDDQADKVQRWLFDKKSEFLKTCDHMTIEFHDLLARPEEQIKRLIDYLDIDVSQAKIESAMSHVRSGLAKHSDRQQLQLESQT